MSLKQLTTGEMINLSHPWVQPHGPVRALLAGIPAVQSVLPFVEAAHAGLVATQPPDIQPEMQKLTKEATDLDASHDRYVTSIYGLLGDLAKLAPTPADAEAMLGLRSHLFPDGIAVVNRTYRDEAGQALLVDGRLTDADRALLAKTPVWGRTLADQVKDWRHTAFQLGQVEDRRQALLSTQQTGQRQADVAAARNQWIRAVNAFAANFDLAHVDEKTRLAVFGPLDAMAKATEGRLARAAKTTDAAEPVAEAAAGGDEEPKD